MKTTKYSLAVALGLIALLAPSTVRGGSLTYDVTGMLTCSFGSGVCPTPLTFSPGSTVMIDPSTGDATGASIRIGGDLFTGAPNTENLGNTSYIWTISSDINLQLARGNSAVGGTPEFASFYQVAPGVPFSDLWIATGTYSLTPVPEPGTLTFVTGLVGLMGIGLRRKQLA